MQGFCRTCSTDQVIQELKVASSTSTTTFSTTSLASSTITSTSDRQAQSLTPGAISSASATESIATKEGFHIRSVQDYSKTRVLSTAVDGLTTALLRTLQLAGVKFLRYMTVDVCNSIRCKAVPLDHLLLQYSSRRHGGQQDRHPVHSAAVSLAQVCMAGLPAFGDLVLADATGLNAQDVLAVHADWSTLRILPYAPKSAVVFGTLHHPPKPLALRRPDDDGRLSPLCTRGLLQRVVETAQLDYGIGFVRV